METIWERFISNNCRVDFDWYLVTFSWHIFLFNIRNRELLENLKEMCLRYLWY